MYAIVDIAGKQFKVSDGQEIFVNRLEGKEGDKLAFDKVHLIDNEGSIQVGQPLLDGMSVQAEIIEHLKGDKVTVFKKKRRKGYQKSNGYRDYLTKIKIQSIGAASKKKAKKEEAKKEVKEESVQEEKQD